MVTRDAILALEGCELDAKVAEVVFGWWWIASEVYGKPGKFRFIWPSDVGLNLTAAKGDEPLAEHWATYQGLPAYSSTWDGTGLVTSEMAVKGYRLWLSPYGANGYSAEFSRCHFLPEGPVLVLMSTVESHSQIPLAVARAALLALQEEE